jgi:hypothetical protein
MIESPRVTGAFLNALAFCSAVCLASRCASRFPPARRFFCSETALGAFTVFFALRLVWLGVNGTFLSCLKQLFIAALAIRWGPARQAAGAAKNVEPPRPLRDPPPCVREIQFVPRKAANGFCACTILFWAAPLGWLGAVADGLSGYYYLLAVKAVMDGLAMTSFVKMFRWPAAMSAIPFSPCLDSSPWPAGFTPSRFSRTAIDHSVNAAAGLSPAPSHW